MGIVARRRDTDAKMIGMQLESARVLVTGATGGLGSAISQAFAKQGSSLIVTGRRIAELTELSRTIGGEYLVADLTEADMATKITEAASPVDVAVLNAGIPATGELATFRADQVDRALDVNLRAPIMISHAIVAGMIERRRGHIVLMASLAGKVPSGGASLYNATKFGLRGFGLALREELRPHGVGVSILFPGYISDAGMLADSGVVLPRYVGTSRVNDVARATIKAVRRNVAEVDVAPFGMRVGARLAGLSPTLVMTVQRAFGARQISAELAEAYLDKR